MIQRESTTELFNSRVEFIMESTGFSNSREGLDREALQAARRKWVEAVVKSTTPSESISLQDWAEAVIALTRIYDSGPEKFRHATRDEALLGDIKRVLATVETFPPATPL